MLRKHTLAAAICAMSMNGYGFQRPPLSRESKRDNIDIDKEYELIQQKKSTLSANDRRWVVAQFESRK